MTTSKTIRVVGAAILRGDVCFAAQRSSTMSNALMWEFPGGKIEEGETPREALAREIWEEFQMRIEVLSKLATGTEYTAKGDRVVLDVYSARLIHGTPVMSEHAQCAWCSASKLRTLEFARADLIPLRAVLRILESGEFPSPTPK